MRLNAVSALSIIEVCGNECWEVKAGASYSACEACILSVEIRDPRATDTIFGATCLRALSLRVFLRMEAAFLG